MFKLYGVTCNESQWACKGTQSEGYTLVNKSTYDFYPIDGHVQAIEQINDISFLVVRAMKDTRQFLRLELIGGNKSCSFEQNFENFYFLTEDTILFDNKLVYSISKNCKVDQFDWLSGKDLEVNTDKKGSPVIKLTETIQPAFTLIPYIVQVYVDVETFKPITSALSTLRNNHHIVLSDSYTFDDLVAEDRRYADIISDYEFYLTSEIYGAGSLALQEELNATN